MPTYVPILDAEIAAESPVTVSIMTRLRDNALAYAGAPSGTKTLWQQTSAPLGWTKDTTHNDKIPRLVTGTVGSGGSVAFSTLFGRTATDGHTLITSEIPAHSHGVTDPGHAHNLNREVASAQTGAGVPAVDSYENAAGGAGNTTVNQTSISINNAGGGGAHSHNIDMRVSYADVIVATKD